MINSLFEFYHDFISYVSGLSLHKIVSTFWFLFIIEIPRYYLLDVIVLMWMSIRQKKYAKRDAVAREKLYNASPLISIIVPGKNEGEHIFKLVQSLKEQTYKEFELVIIDDGSDDMTPVICETLQKNGFISRFLRSDVGGGKASAANLGLLDTKAEFIIHLDADSSLDRDAIEQILLPFYWDERIKAVGGCVKVRNNKESFCTSMQAMEYLESIMVGRTVTSTLKLYRTISGAFGAFEINTLKQIGGWDIGPGLDGDITQKVLKSGHRVVFTHKAVCLTNAPTTFKKLSKQRLRWSRSLVRFRIRKHVDVLDLRHPYYQFTHFLSNLENVLFNFVFDFIWIWYLINLAINNAGDLTELFLLKFIVMIPLSFLSFLLAIFLTERKKEEFFLIKYVPFQSFYSGYYLRIIRVLASLSELFFFKSYKDKWNPHKTSRQAEIEKI
ncbi:glycosyltransferase family 2 protein [Odoribacter sp. OttesenSCG-928-J03]|nr:glycosyltransferase family 2 protein [Odoribacter sp. OttesenSCG-928-J03]MDL2330515.1 glycosyltransferase family 2 protein [Odoribacter sp. OttesenSCG-928-A06]